MGGINGRGRGTSLGGSNYEEGATRGEGVDLDTMSDRPWVRCLHRGWRGPQGARGWSVGAAGDAAGADTPREKRNPTTKIRLLVGREEVGKGVRSAKEGRGLGKQ